MLWEIICGILFVISSGLLFNDKFRENKLLVLAAAAIAIASTYFLTVEITENIVDRKLHEQALLSLDQVENATAADAANAASPYDISADAAEMAAGAASETVSNTAAPAETGVRPTVSSQAPVSLPSPTGPLVTLPRGGQSRPQGKLADAWLAGRLYGSDNEVAALMSVRISGAPGGYSVAIENQMGFVCRLGVNRSGDPAYVEGCRSSEKTRTDRDRIALHCSNNRTERVCTGEYVMVSDLNVPGRPGLTSNFPGLITIARRL